MASPKSVRFMLAVFMLMLTLELTCGLHGLSNLQCPENERQALLSFKHSTIDPSNKLSSWEGRDCCKWHGVGCDNMTGRVVMLDLHNPLPYNANRATFENDKHFRDIIYEESCLNMVEVSLSLAELKQLKYLDLSWNNFSGSRIPDYFGSFQKLEYLNLSSALFGGPVPYHLGNLSSLSSLDLSDHAFSSSSLMVDTLGWTFSLVSLQHLDMSGIQLTNVQAHSSHASTWLPHSLLELRLSSCGLTHPFLTNTFRNMTSLQGLDLSHNDLQGPFQNFIPNMTSLKSLDLSGNFFTSSGPILDELKSLRNLETLLLSSNQLEGSLIKTSANFSFTDTLETLDFSDNHFSGVLPDLLYQLKNLKNLDLSYNSFHGPIPTCFGTFPNIKVLDLRKNSLTGTIPSSIGLLSALESLDLQSNQLTGPIPTSIENLSNLKSLDLRANQLSGQIPIFLGKLRNLEKLYLSENQMGGVVSEAYFAELSKLRVLHLSSNSFSVKLNPGWVPPFQLEEITLGDCNVGYEFPDWLRTQTKLTLLNMSNSGISDSIPNWFHDISNGLEVLDLSHNQIHGKVPNFSMSTNTTVDLRLGFNRFEGPLPVFPSSTAFLDLSNNSIHGSIPISLCSVKRLKYLFLSHNHLSGELPGCWNGMQLSVVDLSFNHITGSIPRSFCNVTYLKYLRVSKNLLSGELPGCWKLSQVEVVDFSFNQLEGTIPSVLCQSQSLQELYLSRNRFHGEIPQNFKNCTMLTRLDLGDNLLSGEIPIWIGDLSVLRLLRLRSNYFTGNLSTTLCNLEYLQILDFGDNQLSGNIPHCFGNLSAMLFNNTYWDNSVMYFDNRFLTEFIKGRELEYIKITEFLVNLDLSSNNLFGQIPEELTRLSGLTSLNLSGNNFTGRIPHNIGSMTSLEALDLSLNHLTGRIPQSISSLTYLSVLDVSYNNLSGPIPSGNQLQTFNDPTRYQGNDELCGPPLAKTCHSLRTPAYVDKEHKEDGNSNLHLFYIPPILGFVVGFWVVCGTLFLKKTWRRSYFQFVDDISAKIFKLRRGHLNRRM